jgi:hypothetical protein
MRSFSTLLGAAILFAGSSFAEVALYGQCVSFPAEGVGEGVGD